MRYLLSIIILFVSFYGQMVNAVELANEKSYALLKNIKSDISETLARINELEADIGDHSWGVFLSSPENEFVKVGAIVEPSTQQVLSVSAEGVAKKLGLTVGDVIKRAEVNDGVVNDNFSQLNLKQGDELEVMVSRQGKRIELKTIISSSFIPRWELYSKSSGEFDDDAIYMEPGEELKSRTSLIYLNRLQERLNLRLSKIHQLETKQGDGNLTFTVTKQPHTLVELGLLLDEEQGEVINVSSDSNADRIGFKAGDRIQKILVNDKVYKQKLSELKLSQGLELQFKVKRAHNTLTLSSVIGGGESPAWHLSVNENADQSSCGLVTFLINPSEARELYRVDATKLNGETVSHYKVNYELQPGRYEFKLYDKIPVTKVTPIVAKRRPFSRKSKKLVVKVEANKRYFLGAKFNRTDRYKTRKGLYWDPVVVKVDDYECTLD
ncbi:hypothetical protein [Kangiella shandongensis]|uniref:hypothetical protein n=1 Tax=Kangiella shandongensis TaxID=2763258 RepID=UPI001CC120A2|nr:hypothetical protein [Kangiella shandongensis]